VFVRLQVEARLGEKSPEERRMERLLRRTAREIYKLRKTRTNKGQLDVQSFRFGLYYL
jgi:protein KIBRA